jgi:type VI secretion system secreted protein Hcp
MPVNAYLKVDGRPGASTGKKDHIDVMSFSFGAASSEHNLVGGTHRPDMHNLSVTKAIDKTSPLLLLDCITNRVIKTVELIYDKPMGDQQDDYLKIHLERVRVSSIQHSGSNENPTESITFAFEKGCFAYNPEEGGRLKGWIQCEFDLQV